MTITIRDDESGLRCYWPDFEENIGVAGFYKWSTSDVLHPGDLDGWVDFQLNDFEDGAKEVSFELTISDVTDEYYLWITAPDGMISDMVGNVQNENKRSDTCYLDNIAPTISAIADNNSIIMIMADSGSGTTSQEGRYYLSTSSTALEGNEWKNYTSGTPVPVFESGTYYLFVETVADSAGHTSTQYGTLTTINEINYHMFGPYEFEEDTTAPTIAIGSGVDLTAATLTKDAYGGYVTNYVPANGVNDEGVKWRIFHTDGSNIYLIADTCVPITNENGTKNYVPAGYDSTNGRYRFDLMALRNYNGTADIDSNIANKWMKKYTEAGYTATNQTDNAKATAYLLDTNAWSGFKDDKYTEYAVGGATLELFVASYNKTHESKTLETSIHPGGYFVGWSSEGEANDLSITGFDTSETLYTATDTSMWLASPATRR